MGNSNSTGINDFKKWEDSRKQTLIEETENCKFIEHRGMMYNSHKVVVCGYILLEKNTNKKKARVENAYRRAAAVIEAAHPFYAEMLESDQVFHHLHDFADQEDSPNTPLHFAASHDLANAIPTLAGAQEVDALNDRGASALMVAVRTGSLASAQQLVMAGAHINLASSGSGETPLLIGCVSANATLEVVQYLIASGADLSARLPSGATAIHAAAQGRAADIVEYLLSLGLNPAVPDNEGVSPLHVACANADADVVRVLLTNQFGVESINFFDASGKTPLHSAAATSLECTRLLLNAGGVSSFDSDGNAPLHIAASAGNAEVVAEFLSHGAPLLDANRAGNTPLMCAAAGGHGAAIEAIGEAMQAGGMGEAVYMVNKTGHTAMSMAVSADSAFAVAALISVGVDPLTQCDRDGGVPLHMAVRLGNRSAAGALLEGGARLSQRNFDGFTPLHLAVIERDTGMIEFLSEAGADFFVPDSQGRGIWILADELANGRPTDLILAVLKGIARSLHRTDKGERPSCLTIPQAKERLGMIEARLEEMQAHATAGRQIRVENAFKRFRDLRQSIGNHPRRWTYEPHGSVPPTALPNIIIQRQEAPATWTPVAPRASMPVMVGGAPAAAPPATTSTAAPVATSTGQPAFDPMTGERLVPVSTPQPMFDPMTGERLVPEPAAPAPRFDPFTGKPLAEAVPAPRFDPQTGLPLDADTETPPPYQP